ncbi:hypothetical protein BOX15_Mlig020174g1 [Macrostomum lignano]|uniref:Protein kinase domain-containing protein n=1 Tax=Macrostomum lignano TaxID=282301 RepID=A0A267GU18_9PLAT|nr:hypothetical protein BOX15_Mlig020174g1 [Macrostomum lignano]
MNSDYWLYESIKDIRFEDVYDLGKELGKGGTSVVHECNRIGSSEKWAAKVIQKKVDKRIVTAEIGILLSVSHENIIRLKEVFETPNHFFMVLELVTGGELFDRIVSRGSYNEKDASQCIRQLLDGLRYLHERGIIHRDLKPENLLYEDEREEAKLKIADFGLSKIADSDVHTRSVCGTPGYCAPEVLLRRGCGTAMDMWSVGVIAFILLGGYEPFYADNDSDMYRRILRAQYTFDQRWWSGISKNARDLIERLLVLDADARLTAGQALRHPWVGGLAAREDSLAEAQNKLREFNARRRLRAATDALLATRHFILAGMQRSQATQHQQEQQKPQSTAGAEMSSAAAEPAFTSIY